MCTWAHSNLDFGKAGAMNWRNTFLLRRLTTLTFVLLFSITALQRVSAWQVVVETQTSSDPAALAIIDKWLESFGDRIYHCKWEYDAERTREPNFQNGTLKRHFEGEWSFSAKHGSSFKINDGAMEILTREIDGKMVSFWPEAKPDGQKFRMTIGGIYPRDNFLDCHRLIAPSMIRMERQQDRFGAPNVFGLSPLKDANVVVQLYPSTPEFIETYTFSVNDGVQPIKSNWAVTDANPALEKSFENAEYERQYQNVKVNGAWLPSVVTETYLTASDPLSGKTPFQKSIWKVIGQYTFDGDASMFRDISVPDGTRLSDEHSGTTQLIGASNGTWISTDKAAVNRNELAEELMKTPDIAAVATGQWYPTGSTSRTWVVLVIAIIGVTGLMFAYRKYNTR
jgi:hypothetical protein